MPLASALPQMFDVLQSHKISKRLSYAFFQNVPAQKYLLEILISWMAFKTFNLLSCIVGAFFFVLCNHTQKTFKKFLVA